MIRIKIEKAISVNKSGTSSRTQKAYSMEEQPALLFREGETYPDKIVITLQSNAKPYPVGDYALSDESFFVAGFGKLEVRPVLVPLAASARQVA